MLEILTWPFMKSMTIYFCFLIKEDILIKEFKSMFSFPWRDNSRLDVKESVQVMFHLLNDAGSLERFISLVRCKLSPQGSSFMH